MNRKFGIVAGVAFVAMVFGGMIGVVAQPPEGGPPGGQRRGPPSPERFVEHAMSFDSDGDGKLDRSELTKFAEEIQTMRARGGRGGSQGGEGGQRRGGPGGPGGPGAPGQGNDGERPERPRRPE